MATLIYLATPIDDDRGHTKAIVDTFLGQISDIPDLAVFIPFQAWRATPETGPDGRVQRTNLQALASADALIALWPGCQPSKGVPMEIGYAQARQIPAIVWDPEDGHNQSWAMAGVERCRSIGEAIGIAQTVGSRGSGMVAKYTGLIPPGRAYPDDAGYDLTYCDDQVVTLTPGAQHSFDLGTRVQLPPGWWYEIVGRSSMWKRGLLVAHSIIDPGWRGPLWASIRNISTTPVQVSPGERLAQLIPRPPTPDLQWVNVENLDPHPRGENGFGSTGR